MSRTWNGYHVLATLLATFAVVLAVNVLFIVKAYTTFSGEDVQRPYLQGVEYNETLERRALQARLGWKATVEAVRTGPLSVRVVVHLSDRFGVPLSQASLHAYFKHPSDAGRDREINLHSAGAGVYEGVAGGVPSGAWDLDVAAQNAPTTPFEAGRRVWLR
jgi:nitrogen fixation protein FixH